MNVMFAISVYASSKNPRTSDCSVVVVGSMVVVVVVTLEMLLEFTDVFFTFESGLVASVRNFKVG